MEEQEQCQVLLRRGDQSEQNTRVLREAALVTWQARGTWWGGEPFFEPS